MVENSRVNDNTTTPPTITIMVNHFTGAQAGMFEPEADDTEPPADTGGGGGGGCSLGNGAHNGPISGALIGLFGLIVFCAVRRVRIKE